MTESYRCRQESSHFVPLDDIQEVQSTQEKLFTEFLEAVDRMLADLSARFPAKEFEGMVALEKVLVQAALGKPLDSVDVEAASQFLGEDVDQDMFLSQLRTLKSIRFQGDSFQGLVKHLALSTVRPLFSEVFKAITLLLAIPVTAATAERSFSALRRIKSWDRASMEQELLNALSVLFVHKPELDLNEIAKSFIMREGERRKVFGWN